MSIFNEDRSTMNEKAERLEAELAKCGLDEVLQKAFESGMNIDEIMYVMYGHTERTVRRYVVQDQLKKAAKKDKQGV